MKKNPFQDIVPSKKSIRNIEIPVRRGRTESPKVDSRINEIIRKKEDDYIQPQNTEEKESSPSTFDYSESSDKTSPPTDSLYKYQYNQPKKTSRKIFYVSLVILIVALVFGISAMFKSAKITVAPKNQTVHLSSNLVANKNDVSGLSFQIVTISKDIQKTVAGNGQTEVQKKASGTVIIFNNTAQSQKLIATTRLETPEGLIFHLNSTITVPGKQVKSGATVPGSIATIATADLPGDKYNVGLKDFTIPGLKGSSKYSQIYAKSKTPMTGGFSGMQTIISSQLLASTSAEMQKDLKDSLATDIVSQIPSNFILYKNSMTFSFSPAIQASTTDTGAVLDQKGMAYGVIFDRGSLTRSIASIYSIDDTVKIDNLDNLDFEYATGTTQFDPSTNQIVLNFSLTGDAKIIWVFDANKLKSDLLGLTKNQARTVIAGYPAISEVWIETNPFWNQTIPKDQKRVDLLTK